MPDFPAGRFAAWVTAWLAGRVSYDAALDALTTDTAASVVGLPDCSGGFGPALSAFRGLGDRGSGWCCRSPATSPGCPRCRS